jgi:DUF971 family protein
MTPLSIELDPTGLNVRWQDDAVRLESTLLRQSCRCRDCRRVTPPVAPVGLSNVTPVGAYGVQLRFDDGHDLGIYPWAYLRELAGLRAGEG